MKKTLEAQISPIEKLASQIQIATLEEPEKIVTIGDGNCAFNAFALGLCYAALEGKLSERLTCYCKLQKELNLEAPNLDGFKTWINGKNNGQRQKQLQLVLRQIAVEYIQEYYDSMFRDVYEAQLSASYNQYKENLSNGTTDNEDTFIVHDHIKTKFEELAKSKKENTENSLRNWWHNIGRAIYFEVIKSSADGPEDKKRWGGEAELSALAIYFDINIQWVKGNAKRKIGIGNGYLENLSEKEQRLLINLGIIETIGRDKFEINIDNKETLKEAVSPLPLSKDESKALDDFFATVNDSDVDFPKHIDGIQDINKLKIMLKKREILIGNRFINDSGRIEKERIKQKIKGIEDETLRSKILDSFCDRPVYFTVKNQGEHWSYEAHVSKEAQLAQKFQREEEHKGIQNALLALNLLEEENSESAPAYTPQEVDYSSCPKDSTEKHKVKNDRINNLSESLNAMSLSSKQQINLDISKTFAGVNRLPVGSVTLDISLGKGAFGEVYKGKWNDKPVAMKEIKIDLVQQKLHLSKEEAQEALEWEISRLSTVSHPNIVQFYGLYEENDKIYLIMEFCEHGDLQNNLENNKDNIKWSQRWQWAIEIATGLSYLHQEGVLHRDLKAENVLLDKYQRAIIADLGVAQVDFLLQPTEASVVAQELQDRRFIAPEKVQAEEEGERFKSTAESDIYALGLVFWQLITGNLPERLRYEDIKCHLREEGVEAYKKEIIPTECPEAFKDLILDCWKLDPKKRPKAEEVKERLIYMAAEFHHPKSDMVITCEQIEELIHHQRSEILKYTEPFLTELRESAESFWEQEENKVSPSSLPQVNNTFEEFLANPASSTLLLLGEAGLGKTLSTYQLASQLMAEWWQYLLNPTDNKMPYLPVLIRSTLATWSYQELNNAFTKALNSKTYKAISSNANLKLLVIVDGYDECQTTGSYQNLPQQLGMTGVPNAKLLVTCRVDTVEVVDLQNRFNLNNNLTVRYFLPFNRNQLLHYLKCNVYSYGNTYTHQNYKQILADYIELRTVLRNPFVLSLFAQSWETISQKGFAQLNRFNIYEGFVEHWINTKKILLSEQVQKVLKANHLNLIESFRDFAANVAFTDFRKENINSLSSPWMWVELQNNIKQDAERSFKEREKNLNGQNRFRALLIMEDFTNIMLNRLQQFMLNSPLKIKKQAKNYEFVHKSFFEYFVAKLLWKNKDNEDQFFGIWNTHNITEEPEIINFLIDCFELLDINAKNVWHQTFINYIKKSKTGSNYNKAAAGAMSFLNKMRFSFSNEDLSGLDISGADLSYGIFDSTKFKDTNLERVNFTGSWLYNANLEKANMQDVIFSELPSIVVNHKNKKLQPKIVCYSENGNYLAIATNSVICLYNASNYTEILNIQDYVQKHNGGILTGFEIECMGFYSNNYLVFGGNTNGKSSILRIWDIQRKSLDNYPDVPPLFKKTNIVKSVICTKDSKHLLTIVEDINNIDYFGIFAIKENTLSLFRSFKNEPGRIIASFFNNNIVINCRYSSAVFSRTATIAFWDWNYNTNVHKDIEIDSTFSISKVVFYNQHILFGYNNGNIKIFYVDNNDIKALKFVFEFSLQVGESAITNLMFLNEELIICTNNDRITIWNINTKRLIKTFAGHTSEVNFIDLSRSNQELASLCSSSQDKRVMLWKIDVANNYNIFCSSVVYLACSCDGKYLLAATQDKKIKIYEVKKGICITKMHGYQNEHTKIVQFSPDNQYVVVLSDYSLKIWYWKISRIDEIYEIKGRKEVILSFFLDNEQLILAISKDNNITFKYWKIDNSLSENSITFLRSEPDKEHIAPSVTIRPGYRITIISAFFINNKKFICLLRFNGYRDSVNLLRILDIKCSKEAQEYDLGSDEGILYLIKNNKSILYQTISQQQIFDENLKLIGTIPCDVLENSGGSINCMAISSDNEFTSVTYNSRYYGQRSYQLNIISKYNLYTVDLNSTIDSLCWNTTNEGLFLVTGGNNGIHYWRLKIQKESTIDLSLCWSNNHQTLILDGIIYSNCDNLSHQNFTLLEQRQGFLKNNNQKLNNKIWLPQFVSQLKATKLVEQISKSFSTSSISSLVGTSETAEKNISKKISHLNNLM